MVRNVFGSSFTHENQEISNPEMLRYTVIEKLLFLMFKDDMIMKIYLVSWIGLVPSEMVPVASTLIRHISAPVYKW